MPNNTQVTNLKTQPRTITTFTDSEGKLNYLIVDMGGAIWKRPVDCMGEWDFTLIMKYEHPLPYFTPEVPPTKSQNLQSHVTKWFLLYLLLLTFAHILFLIIFT